MMSFPKAVVAAIFIGVVDQVLDLQLHGPDGARAVHPLPRRGRARRPRSRSDDMAPRASSSLLAITSCPPGFRRSGGCGSCPSSSGRFGLLSPSPCRCSITESARHLTYAEVLAFAICAISVTVLTGWGGQLSLGQMAFAGIGALDAQPRSSAARDFTVGLAGLRPSFSGVGPGGAVRVGARARRDHRLPHGHDHRHDRAARARPPARGQHARVRDRRAELRLPPTGPVARTPDRPPAPRRRHRPVPSHRHATSATTTSS